MYGCINNFNQKKHIGKIKSKLYIHICQENKSFWAQLNKSNTTHLTSFFIYVRLCVCVCVCVNISPLFGSDVSSVWDYRSSVEQYSAPGGTAKSSVTAQVEHLRNWLKTQSQ
ncbi:hypothetical protein XENORESO_003430 [Xenotaenia resolanae]|uniref:Uncharacterized protein n=1 Tax=Xenotaenia resolanae TaxID=208358 RepID=A0ABV0VZV9_9TELE